MAKEHFNRTKPHCNLGILGCDTQTKTALIAAICKIFAPSVPVDIPPGNERDVSINADHVEFETEKRHYAMVVQTTVSEYIKNIVTGNSAVNAAVLVVSAVNGLSAQVREHVLLAQQMGLTKIVVFLDGVDKVSDPELLDILEMKIRGVLSKYDFDGDDTPFIRGSAYGALKGEAKWEDAIVELVRACDEYLPLPLSDRDKPFLMAIEDVFQITGRGTVVTGRIERGVLHFADTVERVGMRETASFVVTGIEMFRKMLDEAQPGDNVGVLLRGAQKTDFVRGMVLAAPGSISAYTDFEAEIYMLQKEEGGRHTPIQSGYRPQFYFRSIDVTGTLRLLDGIEMAMPGSSVKIGVKLVVPIAMEVGTRFFVRESGRTVAMGVVTRIPEMENNSFLMTVREASVESGRGMAVSGVVERGAVRVGDRVKCSGSGKSNVFTVTVVIVDGQSIEGAEKGDSVRLVLRGAMEGDVAPGMVLSAAD